jgi:hypothetical protein
VLVQQIYKMRKKFSKRAAGLRFQPFGNGFESADFEVYLGVKGVVQVEDNAVDR